MSNLTQQATTSPRMLVPLDIEDSAFPPLAEAVKQACLMEMRLNSTANPARQRARLHSQVDQLVAVVLTVLKQLQAAHKDGALALPELYQNLALCVLSARGSMAEMSRNDDFMYPLLMQSVVRTVRACMGAAEPAGQRASLEACVELALCVRKLLDRSQEQSALATFVGVLDSTPPGPPLVAATGRVDPEVVGAILDCVSQATEFLLQPPQPLHTLSFLPLGGALRDMHKLGACFPWDEWSAGTGLSSPRGGGSQLEWVALGAQVLQHKSRLLDAAPDSELFASTEAKLRALMMELSVAICVPQQQLKQVGSLSAFLLCAAPTTAPQQG